MDATEERQQRAALADKCGLLCIVIGGSQLCYSILYGAMVDDCSSTLLALEEMGLGRSPSQSRGFTPSQYFAFNVVVLGIYLSVAAFVTAALCHFRVKVSRIGLIVCMAFGAWLAFQHVNNAMSAVGLVYVLFIVPLALLLSADYALDSKPAN